MALDPFHPPSQDGHRVLIPEGRKTDGSMGKSFALTCKRSDTSSSLLASHLGWDRSCPSPEPQKTAQRSAQRCSVLFLLGLNHAGMGIGLLSHLSGFNTLISQTSLYFSVPRYHYLLPPALCSQNQHLLGHSKKAPAKKLHQGLPCSLLWPSTAPCPLSQRTYCPPRGSGRCHVNSGSGRQAGRTAASQRGRASGRSGSNICPATRQQ